LIWRVLQKGKDINRGLIMKTRYLVISWIIFSIIGLFVASTIANYRSSKGVSESEGEFTIMRIIDGDTIVVNSIKVRLVGIDTPERDEPRFREAKEFVESLCPVGSTAKLDVDDAKPKNKYGRTLAVVYCNGTNVNAELLRQGYAEIMYIPPSEFDPYTWT
jgi:micrococcal nuclease